MKELIIKKLKEKFTDSILEITDFRNDLTVLIKKESLVDFSKYLHDDDELKFELCKDITAIDWAKRKDRFSIVYIVYSFKNNLELRFKINVDEASLNVPTVSLVWKSAEWYERETFDMYGINFVNHPDLRRVYMPEEFEYHPLRKDFPLLGIPGSLPLPHSDE